MSTIREQEQDLRALYGRPTTRTATPVRCRSCGAWLLEGLDADEMAVRVRVDLTPLSPMGEAIALILGLRTYDLARRGQGCALTRRGHHTIRSHPAGTPDAYGSPKDVLAAHDCTRPLLDTLPTVLTRSDRDTTTADAPPPF